MPAPSRPRGFTGSSSGAGNRPAPNTPMSERQQMALLMQMTSSSTSPSSSSTAEMSPGNSSSSHGPARSRDRNERGETSLHVAAIKGDQDAIKKLLDSGMSPNVSDFAGWTPLHEACNYAHYNVALTLVKSGANVNAKGLDDDTPLHDAALIGHLKLVKMLVEKGADVHSKNRKGKTPVDVAAASVVSYLTSVRDSSSSSSRSSQQVKKPSDQKKSSDETEGSSSAASANSSSSVSNKEDEDIYEFKSTPKDASGTASGTGDDSKSDTRKNDKSSTDEKTTDEASATPNSAGSSSSNVSSTGQSKRPYSDIEGANEETTEAEDTKRKKRKDSDNVKDTGKVSSGNRGAPQRQEKNSKTSGSSAKSIGGITSKVNTSLERKSPCASPKPAAVIKTTDSDVETDENKGSENFGSGGPKVPPLKIVIPQQSTSGDMETGSRNGKNNSTRSHAALPYVVASSSNSNDSLAADKESASSRCASPAESTGKGSSINASVTSEEKNAKATSEERAQQRVLRSSHRSGGQGVDRGSNNSSPQLQSSSPSPAPATNSEASENTTGKTASTSNSSPAIATQNQSENDTTANAPSPSASSTSSSKTEQQHTVELHPRKRKIRAKHEEASKSSSSSTTASQSTAETNTAVSEIHPHDHPFTNCYQMFLNIRKQIEKKHRSLFPIQPRPPQGFKDYLMNRRTYVLAGKTPSEPTINFPTALPTQMKDLFSTQEKERHKLKMQHIVEKEKLGLTVEQEILRVHGKAARSLACQSVPFSACTVMKDDEVYNMITPEQEEKDRNARSRYNGRLFISWLQDVDDKWEKIKEAMVLRHHNEAESLHAVQKMDWEWVMKEHSLCDYKSRPVIDEQHVPMVHVSDDFDLLPA